MQVVYDFVGAIFGALITMVGNDPLGFAKMIVMWGIGGLLIYLAIAREMEPSLLLPMGFGAILVNLPFPSLFTQEAGAVPTELEPLKALFEGGISNELFPLLLFIGIGAMIDFGPLLTNPKLLLFGAAAQLGVFTTIVLAVGINNVGNLIVPGLDLFSLQDAAAIGSIAASDGPTAIVLALHYGTKYAGAIMVAAYSYMALVPVIQPPFIKLLTSKKERRIRMKYEAGDVSRTVRILFPILVTLIAGLIAPMSVALVGFLMFGNLIRECGVLNSLSETAQNSLANLITILLGFTVSLQMRASLFLTPGTIIVILLGLVGFIMDTVGGVLFAKFINLFAKNKVNPMIGACGISAFPMSSRVVHKMGLEEDPQNFLLMHATGVNVGGQIASVIAGGMILSLIPKV